ncbi:MAG: thioesterase family protein [Thermodesulfobacteriota bacterium]|jgi:acyl-CoA thioester hydrolase
MLPSISTSVHLKVPYYDVDTMQIVWNGNYFKYFERARQAFFRERGVDLLDYAKKTDYVFPVIRSMIKHIQPLRMDDEFVCTAILKEARIRIVLKFEIKLQSNGLVCAKGQSEQIALFLPKKEIAFLIPEEIRKALLGGDVSILK